MGPSWGLIEGEASCETLTENLKVELEAQRGADAGLYVDERRGGFSLTYFFNFILCLSHIQLASCHFSSSCFFSGINCLLSCFETFAFPLFIFWVLSLLQVFSVCLFFAFIR